MPRSDPGRALERSLLRGGCATVAGVDEVGRGAWAGPLSVGVAVVSADSLRGLPKGVRDSKMLSPGQRERLFDPLRAAVTCFAVGHATHAECDELGMTEAQRVACRRAFASLPVSPDAVLVDGRFDFTGHSSAQTIVGGDRSSVVIAAASVLAKVTRDRLMATLAPRFPAYRFDANKGYPSPAHIAALHDVGLSAIHRRSWSFAVGLRR